MWPILMSSEVRCSLTVGSIYMASSVSDLLYVAFESDLDLDLVNDFSVAPGAEEVCRYCECGALSMTPSGSPTHHW